MKKTKIVATMSDFRCTEEFVKNLFDAGMDVVRVNSAHVSEEGATHIVETVHRVNPAIPIMIDTKGPEIRVTTIADEYGNSINFRPGDRVAVRGSDGSDKTTRKVVYMNVPSIVSDIPVGARMLIADGELEIRVMGKTDEELDCEFVVGGAMRSRKSVNVPSVSINLPSVTEKDRRFIEWAVKNDVPLLFRTQDVAVPREYAGVWKSAPDIARVVRILVAASLDVSPRPHAGMGLSAYSPVTSPLRRFTDLVNEAQLLSVVTRGEARWSREELSDMLMHLSIRLEAAGQVQRFRPRYWKYLYIQQQARLHGDECCWKAEVAEENDMWVSVSLPEIQLGLRGKRSLFGEKVFPGQQLHVRLGKVNPLRNEAVILDVREY